MTEKKTNKQQKANVPNLRFPGFEGEWEEHTLQDVVTMISGGTPSMQRADYWTGNIPFITAASMHDTTVSTSHQHITPEGLKNGSKLLKKGNLLLLVRGSMLWKQIPICYNNIDVAFNQDIKGIIPNDKTSSKFLLYWFQSKEAILKNNVTATGIGAGKLASDELLALQLLLPPKAEQSKIATLCTLLDKRIETQNKIIEKLETLI
ncbi:MAG: restriction endonuclease subunit S, partial [Mucilaginibacter sp.]